MSAALRLAEGAELNGSDIRRLVEAKDSFDSMEPVSGLAPVRAA
jgi:hypothetical protein